MDKTTTKDVFVESLHMETQTAFSANGAIAIFPCEFELGRQVLAESVRQVSQKGRMVTDFDGTSHFRPYRKDSGTRYTPLMQTAHGEVKECQHDIIIRLAFPKRMARQEMVDALSDEMAQMMDYLMTMKV